MILFIDTSDNKKAIIKLGGERLEVKSGLVSSQQALPAIERMLRRKKAQFSDLTGIKVKTGPGSFTGLKVGVTIANILGWLLGIPVNGKKINAHKVVEAKYG